MFRALLNSLADIIYPRICLACKDKLDTSTPSLDFARDDPERVKRVEGPLSINGERPSTPLRTALSERSESNGRSRTIDSANIGNLVCKKCWSSIKKNAPPFCHSCGRRLEKQNLTKNICPACVKRSLNFDRAFSPCIYDGTVKKLIHAFKYARKDYLGEPLSKLMIEFIKKFDLPIKYMDYLVPVPLHKLKLREREFNQADILSGHIAGEFNKEVLKDTLIRHRFTKTQAELRADERISNIKGSFSVIKPESIEGKNLLLVDDVLTTGATASEAALALKEAGANIVFVLTVAN